ncbi:hypothetical protein M885DRAFT_87480 [Pelagophyceae sp. CCMP2097]|nr:hypothetical protein M885DRAFT_87480 [Pelagophyceae sp. CCMP2097]
MSAEAEQLRVLTLRLALKDVGGLDESVQTIDDFTAEVLVSDRSCRTCCRAAWRRGSASVRCWRKRCRTWAFRGTAATTRSSTQRRRRRASSSPGSSTVYRAPTRPPPKPAAAARASAPSPARAQRPKARGACPPRAAAEAPRGCARGRSTRRRRC